MKQLLLMGEITKNSIELLINEINDLEAPALLYINSEGGSVYDGLMLYDHIIAGPAEIHTMGTGLIASAAVPILAAGKTRGIMPNAWVMVHEGTIKLGRQTPTQLYTALAHERRMEAQYCKMLESRTQVPSDVWDKLSKAETYLNAVEAYQYGLVDYIAKENNE